VGSAVDQIELSQLVSSCVNAQKEKKKREKYVSVPSLIVVVVVVSLSFLGQKDKRPGWDLQLLAAHNRLANLFCWAPPASLR
jgi:hypothetical protein